MLKIINKVVASDLRNSPFDGGVGGVTVVGGTEKTSRKKEICIYICIIMSGLTQNLE